MSAKPLRLAVVGFGRGGQVCAELISQSHDLSLAAIVRRAVSAAGKLPETRRSIPVTTHIGQARDVDAALLCVPTNAVEEIAAQILQHGIPIVDCATLRGVRNPEEVKIRIEAVALRHKRATNHHRESP